MQKPKSYSKAEVIQKWTAADVGQALKPCPIVYKHEGTTIDQDGVRICGSESFIMAVLSHLKPLLKYENGGTRLGIAFSQIQDKDTKELIDGAFRCSVQVHERGPEAKHFNALVEGCRRRKANELEIKAYNAGWRP